MSEENRKRGRPPQAKTDDGQTKVMAQGALVGAAGELYLLLTHKPSGVAAGIKLLAESDVARFFFDDMAAVHRILEAESGETPKPTRARKTITPAKEEKIIESSISEESASDKVTSALSEVSASIVLPKTEEKSRTPAHSKKEGDANMHEGTNESDESGKTAGGKSKDGW